MNTTSTVAKSNSLVLRLAAVLAVLSTAAAAWVTADRWLPPVQQRLAALTAGDPPSEEAGDHHGDAHGSAVLTLSPQTRETLDVETQVLRRQTYRRVVHIPGRVVVLPGTGRREVIAQSSGEVSRVHIEAGQTIQPSQPLFDIRLIHDEGIKVQVELLDALAEKEVVNADLTRLQELESRTPGAVLGTRLLEKQYRRWHLNHIIASRRQMLVLLGLPENDVDQLIAKHKEEGREALAEDVAHYRDEPLLETVTVFAPPASAADGRQTLFVLEELLVVQGQHVDVGETLCLLGDYGRMYIEGEAFERDLPLLRQAMEQQWGVDAAVERRGAPPRIVEKLTIAYLAPKIDAESRSAPFYVELTNELRTLGHPQEGQADEPSRLDWTFRPGQRMELRVPVSQIEDCLRVPLAAIAEDGLDRYVFQVSGATFVRRPVTVLEQDQDFAVLKQTRSIAEGVRIAASGAYQLQLALQNRAAGPAQAHHGHSH